jgi:ATP-dependent Clp protease ATP-binding subunit ClpA
MTKPRPQHQHIRRFWQSLLGIRDKARLTLGDNRRVDLSHSLVFLTSNLRSPEGPHPVSSMPSSWKP